MHAIVLIAVSRAVSRPVAPSFQCTAIAALWTNIPLDHLQTWWAQHTTCPPTLRLSRSQAHTLYQLSTTFVSAQARALVRCLSAHQAHSFSGLYISSVTLMGPPPCVSVFAYTV